VTRVRWQAALVTTLFLAGCSDGGGGLSPSAQRGREIYQAQCAACHHPTDPSKPGSLGPPIKGTPREVLEAKVVRGTYPPGYRPKRDSQVMPPLPALAAEIAPLFDYLK
jgi:mono/diheme cytochrome c family protein